MKQKRDGRQERFQRVVGLDVVQRAQRGERLGHGEEVGGGAGVGEGEARGGAAGV